MSPQSLRILMVDDEPAVVAIARRALEASGHILTHAPSAEAGLASLQRSQFDLVLLDNGLPGAMGIKALPTFVAAQKAPVIMVTGHFNADIERDALLLGAKAVFAKPFDVSKLEGAIIKVLQAK